MSSAHDRRNARKRPSKPKLVLQKGPDKRANWTRLRDSYLERARAMTAAGDTIAAENFYQHAEHYIRMLNALVARDAPTTS
jgi:hypothetical protein